MTLAPTLPGGLDLAAWQRALAAWQPRRLWLTHLLLHRVEALVAVRLPTRLHPLLRGVLHALRHSPDASLLRLDSQLRAALLRELAEGNLIRAAGPNGWELTDTGREGLATGEWLLDQPCRRTF